MFYFCVVLDEIQSELDTTITFQHQLFWPKMKDVEYKEAQILPLYCLFALYLFIFLAVLRTDCLELDFKNYDIMLNYYKDNRCRDNKGTKSVGIPKRK